MMIERHELKNAFMFQMILDDFYESLEGVLNGLHQNSSILGTMTQELINCVGYAAALDKEHTEITSLLKLACDFGTANFVSAVLPDEPFEINYQGTTYPFERKPKSYYTGPDVWLKVFYLAVITENQLTRSILNNVPDSAFEEKDVKAQHFDFTFVRFLKSLSGEEEHSIKLLEEAIQSAHSAENNPETLNYRMSIQLPILQVFKSILTANSLLDNELEQLLSKHKEFWTSEGRTMEVKGWISLPAIALMKFAQIKGVPFTVESDYAPLWITQTNW
jgi:hypothetical protein